MMFPTVRLITKRSVVSTIALFATSTTSNNMKAAQFPGDDLWMEDWKASFGEATIQKRLKADEQAPLFTLYTSWFCPFAQRAWIAAEESGAPYQWVEINPYEVDPVNEGGYTKKSLPLHKKSELHPGFVEASPRGLVPAIQHNKNHDETVWESMPVSEYIDAAFGAGTLAGATPLERARIQIWSAHCTDRIQKQYYRALMSQDEATLKDATAQFHRECRALASSMSDDGPYFLGDRFSLVDIALAPFWQRMLWVGGHYFGLEFPKEPEFDRLHKWWEACAERESIKNTLVCKERLIASYSDYNQDVATSDFAKSMK
jgi:glutathione S-transferase